jgi:hypothetical protein
MARNTNPLKNKAWQPLPAAEPGFDQTGGALDSLDTIPVEDPRIAERTFEGAAITGILGAGF